MKQMDYESWLTTTPKHRQSFATCWIAAYEQCKKDMAQTNAQQPQAVICSNSVCDYCRLNDTPDCPTICTNHFIGRKLTAC